MPKVLVLTANGNTNSLQLAAELREIRDALGDQSNFTIVHESEPRAKDLISRLLREKPEILHFAGHGGAGPESGLAMMGENRKWVALTKDHLADIFRNLPSRPRLVVLNACFTSQLADELAGWADVVIGATDGISDSLARQFAANLYTSIGQSCSIGAAFELARTQLSISGADPRRFLLRSASRTGPEEIVFHARPEIMARFKVTKKGNVRKSHRHFQIELWMRGVDQAVDSVTYQICHDSFRKEERFWEVIRVESTSFWTQNFTSTGDVTLRATAWSRDRGIGTETTLGRALRRNYGPKPAPAIGRALRQLEEE